jgi:hypothetical protein
MKTGLPRHILVADWPTAMPGQVNFNGRGRQRIRSGIHRINQRPSRSRSANYTHAASGEIDEFAAGGLFTLTGAMTTATLFGIGGSVSAHREIS